MDGDGKKTTWDPPNAPKIRPIENYQCILKMKSMKEIGVLKPEII